MERWVDHYSELYSRMNVVSEEALMAMESLSTMDELDSEPTLEEINQALNQPVRPPGMMAYLLKSLSVQKEHSSRSYMRYFANTQCGCRESRATIEMIISLRQLQEKCGSRESHFMG